MPHNTNRSREQLINALVDTAHTIASGIAVALFSCAVFTVLVMMHG